MRQAEGKKGEHSEYDHAESDELLALEGPDAFHASKMFGQSGMKTRLIRMVARTVTTLEGTADP